MQVISGKIWEIWDFPPKYREDSSSYVLDQVAECVKGSNEVVRGDESLMESKTEVAETYFDGKLKISPFLSNFVWFFTKIYVFWTLPQNIARNSWDIDKPW